jgi:acyl dehydratase
MLAIPYHYPDEIVSFNTRDAILYALGIGVTDLKYTYELDPEFQPFPTYALVLGLKGSHQDINSYAKQSAKNWNIPGLPKIDLNRLVHGEQFYEILKPLPKNGGTFTFKSALIGVYDAGKGMVLEIENVLVDQGTPLVRMVTSAFVIGAGGFGGPKRPKVEMVTPPATEPDAVYSVPTTVSQALLYRLSGDYNPLHADPRIGKKLGMKGAILHGLCTFGGAASAVLKTFGGGDPKLFKSIYGRFASPVYPGDKVDTYMWKVGGNKIAFVSKVGERVVVQGGVVELFSIPAKL